jgi:hypothetical protein
MIVKGIVIYPTVNSDIVVIETDLPKPRASAKGDTLKLVFTTSKDTAEEYIREHFPDINFTIEDFHPGEDDINED